MLRVECMREYAEQYVGLGKALFMLQDCLFRVCVLVYSTLLFIFL